jgi:type VI protein secretion system component Hcp
MNQQASHNRSLNGTIVAPGRLLLKVFRRLCPVVVALWLSATSVACAQAGYMRIVTASGHQMAGESTDRNYLSWIPFRQATLPTTSEIAALAKESSSDSASTDTKSVHRPIVIIKDRDMSSLGLLGAMTSHQRLPEVEIVLTDGGPVTGRYKLTDAIVISVRGGGTNGSTDAPMEQLRLSYAKIEIEH